LGLRAESVDFFWQALPALKELRGEGHLILTF